VVLQGYDVPLHLDAALMEEDAVAFEHSTVIAANIAADRLAAGSQLPLSSPARRGEPGGSHFCDRCKLDFENANSLQVPFLPHIFGREDCCKLGIRTSNLLL
jgi:hypothetical protein